MGLEPIPCAADIDGVPMSGLLAEAPQPRAVVVALHGGGTTSAYFDCPGRPRLSLLRVGAALGFTTLALDRPGYGSSAGYPHAMAHGAQRVDLAYGAVDGILGSRSRGAGVFVLAHSLGCELAVRMAAEPRGAQLLGVEIAGTGVENQPAARALLRTPDINEMRRGLRNLLWQHTHLYPAEILGGDAISSGGAHYESTVVKDWPKHEFPALAAQVRVPVRFTLGDHEVVWQSGPAALADIAAMFICSPRVVVNEQPDGGHNLSLGISAAAYHLKVLSFVEECVVARESADAELEAG